jgi:hypothetical protein
MLATEDTPKAQVERILRSEIFSSSEASKRLFRFLADRTFAGEADRLKEYSIGIDALGKPPTYDPRQDATVRLQAARLRQRLAEYYRTEGSSDPIIFDLPKGHFRLTWEERPVPAPVPAAFPAAETANTGAKKWGWRATSILAFGALLLSLAWGLYSREELRRTQLGIARSSAWTPELEELWQPFTDSSRPMILAVFDPFFTALAGKDGKDAFYFRDRSLERWEDANRSPEIASLQKLLRTPDIRPNEDFALRGDMMSVFLMAKLLGERQRNLSVEDLSDLSLGDLSRDNVFVMGAERHLKTRLEGLPLERELVPVQGGIRNLHPRPGEPVLFQDHLSTSAEGEVFALVSQMPGPLGTSVVEAISGSRTWANMGAVKFLTDPEFARMLVKKLRTPSGALPRYYQVVLKVRYMDGVLTDISYVMHRNLGEPNRVEPGRH